MTCHRIRHRLFPILLLLLAILCTGCAATHDFQHIAQQGRMTEDVVKTRHFTLRTYRHESTGKRLHVYIEGDGQSWLNSGEIARDPTPRHALMLDLMSRDHNPALYLGRPCYLQVIDPNCHPLWWTQLRYHPTVVAALTEALASQSQGYASITLIGHSGGGTLAWLVASQSHDPRIDQVITLAGNLNVHAWLQYHQYSPMPGSLDPAREPPLPATIEQVHFSGARDDNILSTWIDAFCKEQKQCTSTTLTDVDHQRGWEKHWPLRDSLRMPEGRP